jgi:flagellar basal-body rod modification protein FlgD
MQDQNPLSPTDPTQFLSQLEGLSQVSSLQSMQTAMQSSQMLTGTSLLGHSVLASGSTANLTSGGTVSGAISAPSGASSLTVAVSDANGNVVKSFAVTPASSGLTSFTWNGTNSSGTAAAAGQYTINVAATVSGASQPVTPLIQSTVNSVTLDSSSNTLDLNTNNGTVALSSVVSVL